MVLSEFKCEKCNKTYGMLYDAMDCEKSHEWNFEVDDLVVIYYISGNSDGETYYSEIAGYGKVTKIVSPTSVEVRYYSLKHKLIEKIVQVCSMGEIGSRYTCVKLTNDEYYKGMKQVEYALQRIQATATLELGFVQKELDKIHKGGI